MDPPTTEPSSSAALGSGMPDPPPKPPDPSLNHTRPTISFKQKLLSTTAHTYFPSWFDASLTEETIPPGEETMETNNPKAINLTMAEKERIRKRWTKALIIKLISGFLRGTSQEPGSGIPKENPNGDMV
ncbi:transcription factor ETV7 isoform 5 [Corchorus capsularis]|uniref:Transcription factor ETV7 isoform 5 n=1 Tax=Corchorus capsularis TaxID=210143 RepID=A0A1R3HLL2_COCAP|nr:transcription factor ETV7 isoform 5 [Corchorus capsularis]